MKLINIIFTCLISSLIIAPAAWAGPENDAEPQHLEMHISPVAKTLQTYASALQANDLEAVETQVASNGTEFTIFEGKGANIGWADYRDHHLAPELSNPDLNFTQYEFTDISDTVSGDWASATFVVKMAYTYKGEDKTSTRRGTAILKQVDGKWLITHLHTS